MRAIFLDRDGVVNRKAAEGGCVKSWEDFSFIPGSRDALKSFRENGFLTIIVTNQRCVARRMISEEGIITIHWKMLREVRETGGGIDAVYFCPHDIEDNCRCRKPRPGMLVKACGDFLEKGIVIDREKSFIIGGSDADIFAGKSFGVRTIKIGGSKGTADYISPSLIEAALLICEDKMEDSA